MIGAMTRAGFILAGGASARMGRDKALLPHAAGTLVEHIAVAVQAVAGSVTLVGAPERYEFLGLPAIPDRQPGNGALEGMATALAYTDADWNLIVACDLPGVTTGLFALLFAHADASRCDCVIPRSPDGWLQPLCGVYHRGCLGPLSTALERGVRKVHDALAVLRMLTVDVQDASQLINLNTPAEWNAYHDRVLSHPAGSR
jgi:molybdopterin-guanine dinucleotide biosynthesis protein A